MSAKPIVWAAISVAILVVAWYAEPFLSPAPDPGGLGPPPREMAMFSDDDALEACRDTVRGRLSRPSAAWFDAWAAPEVTKVESDPPGTPTWDVHFYVDAVEPPYDIEVSCRLS